MKKNTDYIAINKQTWNNKTDVHIASDFYNKTLDVSLAPSPIEDSIRFTILIELFYLNVIF